jgi:hypothetical protein
MLMLAIMLTMGGMAYAQVTCSISSTGNAIAPAEALQGPSANASNVEHTAPIGAGPTAIPNQGGGSGRIRVTCANGAAATNPGVVVLTVSLGVPITNSQTHPTVAAGIRLIQGTGEFITCTPAAAAPVGYVGTCNATNTGGPGANVGINSINNAAGTIVIGLGTPMATVGSGGTAPVVPNAGIDFDPNTTSTFEIAGVLVSTNGKSGATTASLISSGGVNVSPGGATTTVITNAQAGLVDPSVPTGTLPPAVLAVPNLGTTALGGGAAVLNSAGGAVKSNFTIKIQENYADLFKDSTQYNGGAVFPASTSSDVQVNVALNNIPTGFTIAGCSAVLTDVSGANATSGTPSVSATNFTAASPILTVNFNAPVDPDNVDVLWVVCTNVNAGSASLPLPSTPVTAQVFLGPTGLALSGGATGTVLTGLTTGQIPRFQSALVPTTAITVVVFPPSQTTLLVNFAFVGPGYNTGIAIANTTVDPFGTASGGAAPSSGTVNFLLVKNDGTTKTYTTTTGSPGSGLTGAGVVASGSTYVVNLSEILTAAAFGTSFTGYVFVTANFTNAHGAATIYTTSNGAAALSSPVVVLPAVSSAAPRPSPDSGAGLGQ